MPLQAIYQGCYRGGARHADNGTGKPLCIDFGRIDTAANASKWLEVSGSVTCRHCMRSLKVQRIPEVVPIEKQTLRERLGR